VSAEPGGVEPRLVPYAGDAGGATRTLDLLLRRSPTLDLPPIVAVDGQAHELAWGRAALEVPAERTVRVEVWLELTKKVGTATYALEAGETADLEYVAPAASRFPGRLGPRGTVKRRGRIYLGCMIILLVGAFLPILALVIQILARIFGS
jgi:hypothetical protein